MLSIAVIDTSNEDMCQVERAVFPLRHSSEVGLNEVLACSNPLHSRYLAFRGKFRDKRFGCGYRYEEILRLKVGN